MELIEVEKFLSHIEFLKISGMQTLVSHEARKQGVYLYPTDIYTFRKVLRRLKRINKIITEVKDDTEQKKLLYKREKIDEKIGNNKKQ